MRAPNRLGRRELLAGAGLVATGVAGVVAQDPLTFRIMRKGERIGTHALTFRAEGAALTVQVEVEIVVRLALVPIFRYTHHNREHWQAGRLMGFVADTDHDGSPQHASAHREAAGLVVEGSKAGAGDKPGRYLAPPDSIGGTHWNRHELDAPIINPENGRLDHPVVQNAGLAQVTLADGRTVDARRYVLSGDVRLELFYTPEGQWTGLRFNGDDGTLVTYERL